jgi:hypothetical protein|tara:strand:- start:1 stop:168 length:168 start_codon:yes stop_codon:yes gene_type:complete
MNTFLSFIFILFLAIKVKTLIGEEINRIVQIFEFNLLNFSEIQIKRGFINTYIGF